MINLRATDCMTPWFLRHRCRIRSRQDRSPGSCPALCLSAASSSASCSSLSGAVCPAGPAAGADFADLLPPQ
jgi:hypothetical protein